MPLPSSDPGLTRGEPGSVGSRMGAAIVDLAVTGVVIAVGAACALPLARGCNVPGCEVVVLVGPAVGMVLLLVVQGVLFAARGQTLGKRVAGIRIATTSGESAGIFRGIVLRWLPVLLVPGAFFLIANAIWKSASENARTSSLVARFGYNELDSLTTTVPIVLTLLFLLADVAPILLPGRRALHDRLAGTTVMRALDSAPGPGGRT